VYLPNALEQVHSSENISPLQLLLRSGGICQGDAFTVLKTLPDESIDCLVTDPPYGYSFMGKDWDKAVPSVEIWKECLRLLKPGAFAFIMSAPRQDVLSQMIIRLSEAGFRTDFTSLYWARASGFPKAANIGKMVDKRNGTTPDESRAFAEYIKSRRQKLGMTLTKADEFVCGGTTNYSWFEGRPAGQRLPRVEEYRKIKQLLQLDNTFDTFIGEAEREIIGQKQTGDPTNWYANQDIKERNGLVDISLPATPQAQALDGSYGGFQPKPAVEVILVCMKPLSEKTFIDQALNNGKGVTWLDDCRIPTDEVLSIGSGKVGYDSNLGGANPGSQHPQGRFPANILVSDDVLNDGRITKGTPNERHHNIRHFGQENHFTTIGYHDSGSFSRYFDLDKWYEKKLEELPESARKTFPFLLVPKASKGEKNKGLEGMPEKVKPVMGEFKSNPGRETPKSSSTARANFHPTVKPLKLMSYLIILGSRTGDIVLDPFMGSGSTCIAASLLDRQYIGIDLNEEYVTIAQARLAQPLPQVS